MKVTRRAFVPAAGIALTAGYAAWNRPEALNAEQLKGPKSAVAVVKAQSYAEDLVRPMLEGIEACGLNVRGKSILLKPNLVEFESSTAINTDAAVLAAAYEVFHRLGAASVVIGEGPGHRRDTYDLVRQAGYPASVFVDLNRDDVSEFRGFADDGVTYFANTALRADWIVSLPKMKTHHWVGATLSMKNLFGLVPGSVYGWPKNQLHYIGINRSILELNRLFRNTFAIVDGIVGMEGNGPIHGTPRKSGVLVIGKDLRAVDATCCRIMGIDPVKVEYLRQASSIGHIDPEWIDERGERVSSVATRFGLISEFAHLGLDSTHFQHGLKQSETNHGKF